MSNISNKQATFNGYYGVLRFTNESNEVFWEFSVKLCPLCEAEYGDEVVRCPNDNETLVILRERTDDLAGQVLNGRYQLLEKIGEGGMGSVYRGLQEPVGRKVAVKVLRSDLATDKEVVRRFFNEARVVSRLRHPNTVTLYDFGQSSDGDLYIAMELMTGLSLSSTLEDRQLDLPEILEITDQVCQALEEAHDNGIVHRDLKPENIFIDRVGSHHMVKVLDFGIAKVPDAAAHLTRTGTVFGTPQYMSPEQAQAHHVDHRADIYTLGVVLYEMLAGAPPFTSDNPMQVALKHVTAYPEPIIDMSRVRPLPKALSALVMDMLEKDPSQRPQTIKEVRTRIIRLAQETPGVTVEGGEDETSIVRIGDPADTMPAAWRGYTPPARAPGQDPSEPGRTEVDFSVQPQTPATVRASTYEPEPADPDTVFTMPPVPSRRPWKIPTLTLLLAVAVVATVVHLRGDDPPEEPANTEATVTERSNTDGETIPSPSENTGVEELTPAGGATVDMAMIVTGIAVSTALAAALMQPAIDPTLVEVSRDDNDRPRRRERERELREARVGPAEEDVDEEEQPPDPPAAIPLIGEGNPNESEIVPIDDGDEPERPSRPTLLAPIVTPTSP